MGRPLNAFSTCWPHGSSRTLGACAHLPILTIYGTIHHDNSKPATRLGRPLEQATGSLGLRATPVPGAAAGTCLGVYYATVCDPFADFLHTVSGMTSLH